MKLLPFVLLILLLTSCGKSSTPSPQDPTYGNWLMGTWQDQDDAQFKIRMQTHSYEEEGRFKVSPKLDERLTAEIQCLYRQTGDVRIEAPNEQDLADSQGKPIPDHVIIMTINRRELIKDARNGAGCSNFIERANEKPKTYTILVKKITDTEFLDTLEGSKYRKVSAI